MAYTGELDPLQPEGDKLAKRGSYFEMLSSISTELDIMLNDLKKKESFIPTSPRSPLSTSHVSFEAKDRSLLRSSKTFSDTDECDSTGLPSMSSKHTSTLSAPESLIQLQSLDSSTHDRAGCSASLSHSLPDSTLTMMTRLVHTKPIWFLPSTQRAAAAHYLQSQPVATFVVRQARQKDKLSLTLKHPGTGKGPYIESYPIESTLQGVKLLIEDMVFPALDNLIAYHIQTQIGLPCRLALPKAVMAARNLREIQSLALLEEDFWKSAHSRSPTLPNPKDAFKMDSLMHVTQGCVETPTFSMPLSKQSLSEASSVRHQRDRLNVTSPTSFEDGFTSKPDVCGMYGIITTPQVIYQNANTIDKDDPKRPVSSSSQTLLADRKSSMNPITSYHRPPSEFDRQDMRFSSASEFDFVTSTSEQRYPPPKCAPPPPPTGEETSNIFMMPSLPARYTWSLVKPSSEHVEYCLPHDQPQLPPKQNKKPANHEGYRMPACESMTKDVYPAQECGVTSLITQQQQQCLSNHKHDNYRTPPPPASCRQSKSYADSHQPAAAAPRAQEQIQNILQPLPTCNSTKQEPVAWNALPEFDPLFCTSENKELPANTGITPESHTLMKDCMLTDVHYGIKAVTDSSPSNNNNRKSNQMAPMSNFPDRTSCEISIPKLIRVHDVESGEEDTLSDHEIENILTNEAGHLLDNSSQSDCEVNPASSFSAGVPFTENENGNHLLLSQSLEFSTVEANELEQTREAQKKDFKRNKSGISNFNKLRLLAKKGSRGATKKLHRISGKSKKRDASTDIQEAILRVAANTSIGLGALVNGFIRTQEEKCETDKPDIVLRSIRQFMSGTKNYLLNKREPEIDAVIDRHMDELDLAGLEAIVESALHQCVLEPLKSDIGMSCINEYNRNGSMALMDHNIMQAKNRTPEELGIKSNYMPPEGEDLDEIRQLFLQLQEAYSPLNKLDLLLKIVKAIYRSVRDRITGQEVANSMGADDFLPMLIYVLVQCEMISMEIEADYMWGLLDPSMLSGEGGYYLTTLSSAICVLKQFEEDNTRETQGFLTVLAAVSQDPTCISLKTLPVLPGMLASEVCGILAQRMNLRDAEDYRLYLLRDSIEIPVEGFECPLNIKNEEEADGSRGCRFGFRPVHTEVNWPRTSGSV